MLRGHRWRFLEQFTIDSHPRVALKPTRPISLLIRKQFLISRIDLFLACLDSPPWAPLLPCWELGLGRERGNGNPGAIGEFRQKASA